MPLATDGVVVEVKSQKLRAYFAPDELDWTPGKPFILTAPGERVTFFPAPRYYAVVDRLDAVFGPDNWRVTHDNPGKASEYVRCVLAVRFTAEGDWVTRVGVSESRCPNEAHANSFRDAAYEFGVGRYLFGQSHVTAYTGDGKCKDVPRVSQHLLPEPYRECGRERARVIRDLLESAVKSAQPGVIVSEDDALIELVARYGGDPDARIVSASPKGVYLSRVENRHADAILACVHRWIADIAAGRPRSESAPLSLANPDAGKKEEKKSPPNATANSQESKPAGQSAGK